MYHGAMAASPAAGLAALAWPCSLTGRDTPTCTRQPSGVTRSQMSLRVQQRNDDTQTESGNVHRCRARGCHCNAALTALMHASSE